MNQIKELEKRIETLEFYQNLAKGDFVIPSKDNGLWCEAIGKNFLVYKRNDVLIPYFVIQFVYLGEAKMQNFAKGASYVKINENFLECWHRSKEADWMSDVYYFDGKGLSRIPQELYLNKYYNDDEAEGTKNGK